MSKLNKTQTANQVTTLVQQLIEDNAAVFKAGKAEGFSEVLTKALFELIGPKTGGGVSDKVVDGMVYCNYFDTYLPAEDFNTKTNKKFKANCIEAEKILRKIKNLRASVERGATSALRAKTITQAKWFEIMDSLDSYTAQKFNDVSEIKWNDVEVSEEA
jgi:hypothetical protein